MNKEQEKIALMVIKYLKENNGVAIIQNMIDTIHNLKDNRFVIIFGLIELKLINKIDNGSLYILTDAGHEFESFEKLRYEQSLELSLAKSNIKANDLNEENSKFNKWATIVNIIIGVLNAVILIWQIL